MCGLLGFSGNDNFDINKVRLLFYANQKRGEHSYGHYTEENSEESQKLFKAPGKVIETYLNKGIKKKLDITNFLIAHTRQATVGEKTKENAHPFRFDNIIGAHNGTLKNHKEMIEGYVKDDVVITKKNFNESIINMDSKIFFKYMSLKEGDDRFQIIKDFEGAAALMFRDTRDDEKVLYIWRNHDRPLHYGFCEEGMYISSEKDPLLGIGCEKVEQFETNKLYRIVNGQIRNEVKLYNSPKYKKKVYTNYNKSNSNTKNSYKNLGKDFINDLEEFLNDEAKFKYLLNNHNDKKDIEVISNKNNKTFTKIEFKDSFIEEFCHETLATRKFVKGVCYYDETLDVFVYYMSYDDESFSTHEVVVNKKLIESFLDWIEKKNLGLEQLSKIANDVLSLIINCTEDEELFEKYEKIFGENESEEEYYLPLKEIVDDVISPSAEDLQFIENQINDSDMLEKHKNKCLDKIRSIRENFATVLEYETEQ